MKKTQTMTQMFLPGLATAVDREVSMSGPDAVGLKAAYEVRIDDCQRYRSLAQAKRALTEDSRRTLWKVWYHSAINDGTALYEEPLTP